MRLPRQHLSSVLALPLCSLAPSPQPQLFPLPVWGPQGGPKATCSSVCTRCPCSAFLPPATTSFIWNGPWKPSKLGPPVPQVNRTMDKDPFSPHPLSGLSPTPVHVRWTPVPCPRPSQLCWMENRCTGIGVRVSCLLIINLENYRF